MSVLLMLGAIAGSARISVYIMAGQSNADGRALVCEMLESIQDYVKNNGSDLIMMSYCNGTTRKVSSVIEEYVQMYEGGISWRRRAMRSMQTCLS